MIDLHTHTLFSDGVLLPAELVRRAEVKGYTAIAITDHVDMSNIDFVIPRIVKVCKIINKNWKIKAIPGIEITHAPLKEIPKLVKYARIKGAKIVVGHGETISEPVIPGTNRAFIEAKVDILAHPGKISEKDAILAGKNGVYLEITTRKSHSKTNKHVYRLAKQCRTNLVLNTDSHQPDDLINDAVKERSLRSLGMTRSEINKTSANSVRLIKGKI